jgi:peptide-methionine (S)-S-oxide reductase
MSTTNLEIATIGGGCFWCTEAVFQRINGVEKVVSGYSGGNVPGRPTYREICSGLTGHAEVIQVSFNSEIISYKTILEIFMTTHDPSTLNRQGADVGTQYRSVIFYHDDIQKALAHQVVSELQSHFDNSIVTEISPLTKFFEAEDYHQNYYNQNKEQGYCSFVISPKLQKLRSQHAQYLKS